MRRVLLVALFANLAAHAAAQSYVVGDAWISGRLTAGTTTAAARLEVVSSSLAAAAFQVSGVDETPFLVVASSGDVGLGISPNARLDVMGTADVDNAAMILRNGNLYPAASRYQLTFGENGTINHRHAIRSVHSSSTASNGLDFLLWTPATGGASALGALEVLSLVTTSLGSTVHICEVGISTVDLMVSNGATPGGGVVHRLAEVAPSSREWKTDISYFTAADEDKAATEIAGLKHASFRYKKLARKGWERDSRQPLRRGLIYEEVPDVLKGPGRSLVVDERISELELAMKSLMRRLEAAETEPPR